MDDEPYHIYMGGFPGSVTPIPNSVASEAPYIGCIRDVIVQEKVITDFNSVPNQAGLELGICKSELPYGTDGN